MPAGSQRAFNSNVKASRSVTLLAAASIKGGGVWVEEEEEEECALGRNRSTAPPKKQDGFSHLSMCRRLPSLHYARGGIMSTKR